MQSDLPDPLTTSALVCWMDRREGPNRGSDPTRRLLLLSNGPGGD